MARRTTDNIYIIIYHEKSQLNGLVWGSLTLAPISRMQEEQGSKSRPHKNHVECNDEAHYSWHCTHDRYIFVSILRHLPVSISLPFPAFQYAPSLLLFSALYHIWYYKFTLRIWPVQVSPTQGCQVLCMSMSEITHSMCWNAKHDCVFGTYYLCQT